VSLVVGANAIECVGRCLWKCWQMPCGVLSRGWHFWCIWSVSTQNVLALWRHVSLVIGANAGYRGKCLRVREFWGQMLCVVEANALRCGGECLAL